VNAKHVNVFVCHSIGLNYVNQFVSMLCLVLIVNYDLESRLLIVCLLHLLHVLKFRFKS